MCEKCQCGGESATTVPGPHKPTPRTGTEQTELVPVPGIFSKTSKGDAYCCGKRTLHYELVTTVICNICGKRYKKLELKYVDLCMVCYHYQDPPPTV